MKYSDWYGIYIVSPYGGFKRGSKGLSKDTGQGRKVYIDGYVKSIRWLYKPLKNGQVKRLERVHAICEKSDKRGASLRVVPKGRHTRARQAS